MCGCLSRIRGDFEEQGCDEVVVISAAPKLRKPLLDQGVVSRRRCKNRRIEPVTGNTLPEEAIRFSLERRFQAMKLRLLVFSILVLSLAFVAPARAKASAAPSRSGTAAVAQEDHDHDWDAPPAEFRDAQRKGFHDGVEGARKDFDNHREPNVENREEFRHPHVPRDEREDYREGFRQGYDRAMSHLNSIHY
jgi:hypothetical protein